MPLASTLMMKILAVTLFTLALGAGCKKKEDNAGTTQPGTQAASGKEGSAGSAGAPTDRGDPANPGAGSGVLTDGTGSSGAAMGSAGAAMGSAGAMGMKSEYKPDEIWAATSGKSRMDLMEMFKDGATVTGTVKSVKDDPTGEYVVMFDAGNGKMVEAMIGDPKPARDRKLKAGDTVTVSKCQVANPTDTSLPLRTCDLK